MVIIKEIVAGSCLASSMLVRGFGCRRSQAVTWVFDTQPDLDVPLRAALPCSLSKAVGVYFCEYYQSQEHIQLNVLNADKSSSFDKSLFSEPAKSFRARIAEWIVSSSWLIALGSKTKMG